MSSKNRTVLKSDLAAKVPSTPSGVTAANVRGLITDLIDSTFNSNDDGTPIITANKATVGLSNVDNTSDANKPVSSATAAAIATAVAAIPAFTPDTPETITITGAGTSSNTRPPGVNDHLVKVTVAAGTYANTLTAGFANSPTVGTKQRFVFSFADASFATINLVLSGSLTIPITNPSGLAGIATLDVQYTGSSAWTPTLQSDGTTSAEMRFTIADVTPGSKLLIVLEKPITVSSWGLVGDASGSIAIGIRKATTIGGLTSVVASAPPTVSTAQNARSSTLTGWTPSWAAGDIVEISVTSSSGSATQWSLVLGGTRS